MNNLEMNNLEINKDNENINLEIKKTKKKSEALRRAQKKYHEKNKAKFNEEAKKYYYEHKERLIENKRIQYKEKKENELNELMDKIKDVLILDNLNDNKELLKDIIRKIK
jgi:hypothetical protein